MSSVLPQAVTYEKHVASLHRLNLQVFVITITLNHHQQLQTMCHLHRLNQHKYSGSITSTNLLSLLYNISHPIASLKKQERKTIRLYSSMPITINDLFSYIAICIAKVPYYLQLIINKLFKMYSFSSALHSLTVTHTI